MADELLPCRHRLGEFAPGRWACSSSRLVAPKGVTDEVCRDLCPWVDHEREAVLPPALLSEGSGHGVVIGTYDSLHAGDQRFGTEAVELNLRVLRSTCGTQTKILVCDDASPKASQERYRFLCSRYGAEFSTNSRRMGHTSGDMIVFHKAIRWAWRHRLRTVTKLSHRLIIDIQNWIQLDSEALLASPYATQAQMLTNFGQEQIRTECVMMVVSRWHRCGVLHHYRPRRIPYWNESHTFEAIARLVDGSTPYPHFLPWKRLTYVRGHDAPPVYFRDMQDAESRFRSLAARYGVRLKAFSAVDSCSTLDYQ